MEFKYLITIILLCTISVFSQQKMTDRDIEGLKGNVKSVFVETSNVNFENGKYLETKKIPSNEMSFDKNGSFLTNNSYQDGKLFIERRYNFLEGKRVSIHKFSQDETLPAPPSMQQSSETFDKRFTFKYEYKYDEKGRRIEEEWYNNSGKLWIRDLRKYDEKGNEIEFYRYYSDGKLGRKTISEFDNKGNIIKTYFFNQSKSDKDAIYTYKYTFDSKGNWIKRIISKSEDEVDKTNYIPFLTVYRKITYFK